MISILRKKAETWLTLPELCGLQETGFDTPETAAVQRRILHRKKSLALLYREYCRPCIESANRAHADSHMVEVGAGTSPLKEHVPGLIASDVLTLPWLDMACSAYALPFRDHSLDRIFLMFVCHHLGRMREFLDESYRCLRPGGEMVIIDPAITIFSRFYYKYFHVDRMDLESQEWAFEGDCPLSDSNIALSWIVFFRDRKRFTDMYPHFVIDRVAYNTSLAYLFSGGLRFRQMLPTFLVRALFGFENWIIRHVTRQMAVTMALTIRRPLGRTAAEWWP